MKVASMGTLRDQPYLLFAKEVDAAGKVIKIWVDVNLPDKDNFACLTAMQRSLVRIRVEKSTNDALQKNINSPLAMVSAEIMGMDKLREEVIKIVLCCSSKNGRTLCNTCNTKEDNKLFFQNSNFNYYDAKIEIKSGSTSNLVDYKKSIINLVGNCDIEVNGNTINTLTVLKDWWELLDKFNIHYECICIALK